MLQQARFLTGLAALIACAGAEPAERITGPRPLGDIAARLQAAWGRPVTYEEPPWMHLSDVSGEGDPLLHTLGPRVRSADLPVAALGNRRRDGDATMLRAIVAAFNRDQGPLAFGVVESRFGLHIIPVQLRNAAGATVPANVLLDGTGEVPYEDRTASEHLRALGWAIGREAGIRVEASTGGVSFGFDRVFVPPGAWTMFRWGARRVKARGALIDLLSRSAIPHSWRLHCQPETRGFQSAFCVLNVEPVRRDRRTWTGRSPAPLR